MQEQPKNKEINEGIKNYQVKKRNNTVKIIEEAIDTLNSLDKKITVAKLVEFTGLHRTTFYKPEIREIWDTKRKVKVVQSKKISKQPYDVDKLLEENEKIQSKYLKSLAQKEELIEKNGKLRKELEEEKQKNAILRGQILQLQNENNILRQK